MAVRKLAEHELDLPFISSRLVKYNKGWMSRWVNNCQVATDRWLLAFRNRFCGYLYRQFLKYAASPQDYWVGGEHLMFRLSVVLSGFFTWCRKWFSHFGS